MYRLSKEDITHELQVNGHVEIIIHGKKAAIAYYTPTDFEASVDIYTYNARVEVTTTTLYRRGCDNPAQFAGLLYNRIIPGLELVLVEGGFVFDGE